MVVIESNRALLIEIICFGFETLHRLSYGLLRMHPRAEIVNESLFFSANLKKCQLVRIGYWVRTAGWY
jgi:hypothetical protein